MVARRGVDDTLSLHEVYYDDEGKAWAMTEEPCSFICDKEDGAAGMVKVLRMALKDAMEWPVFEEPEEGKWPGKS